jgi:hypothetical protein
MPLYDGIVLSVLNPAGPSRCKSLPSWAYLIAAVNQHSNFNLLIYSLSASQSSNFNLLIYSLSASQSYIHIHQPNLIQTPPNDTNGYLPGGIPRATLWSSAIARRHRHLPRRSRLCHSEESQAGVLYVFIFIFIFSLVFIIHTIITTKTDDGSPLHPACPDTTRNTCSGSSSGSSTCGASRLTQHNDRPRCCRHTGKGCFSPRQRHSWY